jgi:hypothetical protein
MLPKIHKFGIPGRPICSSNNHPTERISRFVDAHIRKYMHTYPSYVRDTQDFIQKVKDLGPIPEGSIIATLDVTSLYTNIPNQDGINAVVKQLCADLDPEMNRRCLVKLLEKVLARNYFTFNGQMYLQIGGTAMGTPIAPSYANTFMGEHENKLLDAYPLKPFCWLRFLDDVFCVFTHGKLEFDNFVEYLNASSEAIKFTVESSEDRVNFLDTTVVLDRETNCLYTTVYSKPTDTHDYLHFTSSHPDHCKTGGPKGQLLRMRRICTKDEDFEINSAKMIDHYLRRGYPKKIMAKHMKEIRSLKQEDLLAVKQRDIQKDRPILSLEYNPANPDILGIVNSQWHLLEASPKLSRLFPNTPMLAHKRSPNLRDTLVRATTEYPTVEKQNIPGFNCNAKTCRRYACSYCPKKHQQGNIKSRETKESYRTVKQVTCETKNVIYCLQCTQCGKQYVGETKRSFRIRLSEHLGDIRNNRNFKPVARHFNSKHHSIKNVTAVILESITKDPEDPLTTDHRKNREFFWIYRLRTVEPQGLNSMC